MSEPFKTYSAVFPIILDTSGNTTRILLHRRQNTGYQDGKWDIAGSGHVDEGETAKAAVVRECKEELGIDVAIADISFVHLSHRFSPDRTYYDIYFTVSNYVGTPSIMERNKCSELSWFNVDNLPSDLINCRRIAINEYTNGNLYGEIYER